MRHSRTRPLVVGLAFLAAIGFFLVNIVDPYSGATATPAYQATSRFAGQPVQHLAVSAALTTQTVTRDAYTVKDPPPPPPPPPAAASASSSSSGGSSSSAPAVFVTPDPGSAQAYAQAQLASMGMGSDQYACLYQLWMHESGWRVNAANPSGAYGIPQALPGSKMGPGWQTDATVQINWGLGYVNGRYGSPCGAWSFWQANNWY